VIIGGLWVGVIAGIIYNALLAATYGRTDLLVWMLSSLLVACVTYYFYKKDWIDIRMPARLITVGLVTGLLNAVLTLIIIHSSNLPPYQGFTGINAIVLQATGDPFLASVAEQTIAEMMDKTVAVFLAAAAIYLLQNILEKAMAEGPGTE
jgi:LytS/YehU family sensor histidine kinase